MTDILDQIIDRVHRRAEKWDTVLVPTLPEPEQVGQTQILGTYSVCCMNSRQRLLLEPTAICVDHCKESPTSLARDYLEIAYKRGPLAKHTQIEAIKDHSPMPPNYAKPETFGYGFYIDIKAAYWNMMQVIGWNVDYWPGKWLMIGRPPADFPFSDHKVARNCLVSSGLLGEIPMWSPERGYFMVQKGNRFANLQLWRLIQDVLNTIAGQAISEGAIYANTDGFIAPTVQAKEKVEQVIADWGLASSVKDEGRGSVISSGCYQVGRKKSGHLQYRNQSQAIESVQPPSYWQWLQQRFSYYASRLSYK